MKTYVFTYFVEKYNKRQFRVDANRFTQAFDSFSVHISVVSKDFKICAFSHSYIVMSNFRTRCCFLTYNHLLALENLKGQMQ